MRGDKTVGVGRRFNFDPAVLGFELLDRRALFDAAKNAVFLAGTAAQIQPRGLHRARVHERRMDPRARRGRQHDAIPFRRLVLLGLLQSNLFEHGHAVALLQAPDDLAVEQRLAADVHVGLFRHGGFGVIHDWLGLFRAEERGDLAGLFLGGLGRSFSRSLRGGGSLVGAGGGRVIGPRGSDDESGRNRSGEQGRKRNLHRGESRDLISGSVNVRQRPSRSSPSLIGPI